MWSRLVKPQYDIFAWDYWFGEVDARPLGIFRVLFALLLLKDAIYHLFLAREFYSDAGHASRALMSPLWSANHISLMDALGADWQVIAFFLLWIAVLICLLLGYHTRLMCIFNWILILSIHERNIYLLNGADTAMRVLSFWIIFLPLGRAYALDRLRQPNLLNTAFAFPLRIIQLQFALIYLFTALVKSYGTLWLDGSAVYHALQLTSFTHATGDWVLANAPYGILQAMTFFTLFIEVAFIFLVLIPVGQPYLRVIGLAMGALMHIGIGVLMAIPNFSLVMLIGYLLFFEGTWLVKIGRKLFPDRQFDEVPSLAPAGPFNKHKIAVMLITASLLFTVMSWNLFRMRPAGIPLSTPISSLQYSVLQVLGLRQNWDMFAPEPSRIDGGLLEIGTLADGRVIELRTGHENPTGLARFYFGAGARWKKYDESVYHEWATGLMLARLEYRCREWHQPENPLIQIELIYRYRETHAIDDPPNIYQDRLLWTTVCETVTG